MPMKQPGILVLPINSLESYREKGTADQYRAYFNPTGLFGRLIALYPYDFAGKGKVAGVPVVRIQKRFLILDFIKLLVAAALLVKQTGVSVIRTYGAELEGLAAVIVGKIYGIPSVVSLHGEDDAVIKARGFSIPVRLAAWVVITLVLSLASEVWCVSEGVADYARRRGGRKGRVRVIYNKVQIDKFLNSNQHRKVTRQELGYEEDDFVLVHVGRFSGDKRIHIMVEALALLHSQGAKNAKLLLVGGPPREASQGSMDEDAKRLDYVRDSSTYEVIPNLIIEHSLQDHVTITGLQPHERIPFYLAAADAYVIAMKRIGFGIAVAEASAAGLPLLGSTVFQQEDRGILINPNTGLVFNPESPSELSNRALFLMNNPETRKRLGLAARENARRFGWDRIAEREAGYYRNLLGIPS